MKIAIKGHPTRGTEVIQILESLGGKNISNHKGKDNYAYYISSINNCIYKTNLLFSEYKHYTLEEFEREFPFKIGDRVTTIDGLIGIIDRFEPENHLYCIKADVGGFYWCITSIVKSYKEMKEERNVTLTLEKAKEWYNKGGELKEIALQAFTEKELILLPRSWEEFCKNYPIKDREAHVDSMSSIVIQNGNTTWRASIRDRNICPSKKSAQAHLAMIQLEQLRDCWLDGWTPKWDTSNKWCIRLYKNQLHVGLCTDISRFLTFPTREMAEDFLKCFGDLIELAKDLI